MGPKDTTAGPAWPEWIDKLRPFAQISKVLVAHLHSISGVTEEASLRIITRLQTLEREVEALMLFVQSLIEVELEALAKQEVVLGRIEQVVAESTQASAKFRALVAERIAEVDADRATWAKLMNSATAMKNNMGNINIISDHTRILSINARIEATRAGEYGRGFDVVAKQVKNLANDTRIAVDQVLSSVDDIAEQIRIEQERSQIPVNDQSALLSGLWEWLQDMGSAFKGMRSNQPAMIMHIQRGSALVGQLVRECLAEIQFQDITRQRVDLVVQVVGHLDRQVARLIAHVEQPEQVPLSECTLDLEGIIRQYVMSGQRDAHATACGEGPQPDAPSPPDIELFDQQEGS